MSPAARRASKPRPSRPTHPAVALPAAVLALAGCTSESVPDVVETTTTGSFAPGAVQCPGQLPAFVAPLRGLNDSSLEAYVLDEEPAKGDSGGYCLQVYLDGVRPAPVEVTIEAPDDAANYGVSQTTTDAEGSEELAYFPFAVYVSGACRPVTATVTLRDGSTHEARTDIGTGCPEE